MPPNRRLMEALGESHDSVPDRPPQGPPGALPPSGTPPEQKSEHTLPPETDIYRLHVSASRNNTILTFTRPSGNIVTPTISAGLCGFKKVERSSYEAGYQCAVRMFDRIVLEKSKYPGEMRVEVLFKGFGIGREAFYRALMATEGDQVRGTITRLTDATPLKIGGGTRAKKVRRL